VSCLDADAFAEPPALKRMMWQFLSDPEAMAVSPSVIVHNPKGFFQKAQQVEYDMAVFIKKILGVLQGIHVTPGPLSIYRKKVFTDLGLYRKAHLTEDMEIAYRMQVHGYKIVQCYDAYVYTVTPDSFKKLYKQRLRWMYGFINNTIDYRKYVLKPKYGAFSLFTIPSATITLFGTVILSLFGLVGLLEGTYHLVQRMIATQWLITVPSLPHFSFFFIDTRPMALVIIVLYALLVTMVLIGQKMRNKKALPGISLLYFIIIFAVMAPLWLAKAIYNTIAAKETAWR
jgi:biofilm PGA synthesis N-glycosyltransferase PgaC